MFSAALSLSLFYFYFFFSGKECLGLKVVYRCIDKMMICLSGFFLVLVKLLGFGGSGGTQLLSFSELHGGPKGSVN